MAGLDCRSVDPYARMTQLPIELAEYVSIQGCNNFGLRFGLSLGAPRATRVCAESASIDTGICQL